MGSVHGPVGTRVIIAWFAAALLVAAAGGSALTRPAEAAGADVAGAGPNAEDLLSSAQASARKGRWTESESAARQVLLSLPVLNPVTRQVNEAFDLVVRARTASRPALAESLAALGSLDSLARHLYFTGRLSASRLMLDRSITVRRSLIGGLDLAGAKALHLLGHAVFDLGEYELARRDYEESGAAYVRLEGPNSEKANGMTFNLGNAYGALGDLPEARRLYEQAGAFWEKDPSWRSRVADVQLNLSSILTDLSDPMGARRAAIRCIEIRRSIGLTGGDVGDGLANLADTYMSTGEYERALATIDSAEARYASTDWERGRKPPLTHMRSQALMSLGRLEEAQNEASRSITLFEQQLGPDHPELVEPLATLGEIRLARGDWIGAEGDFERCRLIDQRALPPDHWWHGRDLLALARTRLARGDSVGALALALDAQERLRNHLVAAAPGLTANAALRHDARRAQALHTAISSLSTLPEQAELRRVLDAVVRSRAIVFEIQSTRLHSWGDNTIDTLRIEYERACTRLANLTVRAPTAVPVGQPVWADSARAARERAELALAQRSTRYTLDRAALAVGLQDVEVKKPPESALVSFVRHSDPLSQLGDAGEREGAGWQYSAFVMGVHGEITVHRLGEAKEIEAAVQRWREEAGNAENRWPSETTYRRVATRLRKLIWDPIEPDLDGARSVCVVPDGALHLVNFNALPDTADGYLLEREPRIVHLSAERDLAPEERHVVSNVGSGLVVGGLLVVGGPEFDMGGHDLVSTQIQIEPGEGATDSPDGSLYRSARTQCTQFAELRVPPLPGTLKEAREVATLWQSLSATSSRSISMGGVVQSLTGAAATEEQVKRLAPGREALHLATHGFFVEASCAPKGLDWNSSAQHEGALLRAGLALSGFNQRETAPVDGEDGVLTAEEVAAMDLRSVRCVVLSACESGVGEVVSGEGVFGLRRAFRLAGARTLVTSLWKVDDMAARYWAEHFHRAFLGGGSPADAATDASRAMLGRARARGQGGHPHGWGAFVASGDWHQ